GVEELSTGSAGAEQGRNTIAGTSGGRAGGTGLRPDAGPCVGPGTECVWIIPLDALGGLRKGARAAGAQAADARRDQARPDSTYQSCPCSTASRIGHGRAPRGTLLV